MPMLVRKISEAKWTQNDVVNGADPSADAITNCTKTEKNCLSVWRIEDATQMNEAVLALASGRERLDSFSVVTLPEEAVVGAGLRLIESDGGTPVKDLIKRHRDIGSLSYRSLGVVAQLIIDEIKAERVARYTRVYIRSLLLKAIDDMRLDRGELDPKLQHELSAVH